MNKASVILVLCALWCASAAAEVTLFPGQDVNDIASNIHFLVDESRTLNLAAVIEQRQTFILNTGPMVNPGVSDAVIWLRLPVRNAGSKSGTWVLALNRFLLPIGEIHIVRDGQAERLLANDAEAFRTSFELYGTLAGRFELEANQSADVFVRFQGANWSGMQMSIHEGNTLQQDQNTRTMLFYGIGGIVLLLLLYGTISFLYLGVGLVIFYALGQVAFFAFYAQMSGYTTLYLWPEAPEFGRVFSPLSLLIFLIAMASFARLFFDTAQRVPRYDFYLRSIVVAALLVCPLTALDYLVPTFNRQIPLLLTYVLLLAVWLTLPVLAIWATIRYQHDAWPIMLAWSFMAAYVLTVVLLFTGVADMPFGKNSFSVPVLVETIALTLAIALRIRRLRINALGAERDLAVSLQQQLATTQQAMRAVEQREWALKELAEKGRLLLATGHDTRQMLGAMRNFSHDLRDGATPDAQVQVANHIDELTSVLNDVLTTAISGSHGGGITDDTLALDTLSERELLEPLNMVYGHAAADKGIDLRIRGGGLRMVVDRVLVLRVLGNLVSNAIAYSDDGAILVGVRRTASGLRLQVHDSGPGLSEQALARLLDEGGTHIRLTDQGAGLGSGLGIARGLARRMGGEIRARSKLGAGSCFELFLPYGEQPETPATFFTHGVSFEPSKADGVPFDRGRSLQSVIPDVVIIGDREELSKEAKSYLQAGSKCIVTSIDRSAEARTQFAEQAQLVLYEPVSSWAATLALRYLLQGGHRS